MSIQQMFLGGGGAISDSYWWRYYTDTYSNQFNDIAVDSDGNVIAVGTLTGSNQSIFLKYDKDGTLDSLKKTTLAGNHGGGINGVCTDSSGNFYTAEKMNTKTNGSGSSIDIVKYNSSLTKQWNSEIGSEGSSTNYGSGARYDNIQKSSICTDGTNVWIGCDPNLGSTWGGKGSLVVLDASDGSFEMDRRSQLPQSGSASYNTNMYATAITSVGDCAFVGKAPWGSQMYEGAWVGLWENETPTYWTADPKWSKHLKADDTSASQSRFEDVAVDSSDNIIAVGQMNTGGAWNGMVMKFSNKSSATPGTVLWEKSLGGGFPSYFTTVVCDSNDDVIVGGWSEKTDTGITGTSIQASYTIIKYSGSNGNLEWMHCVNMDNGYWTSGAGSLRLAIDSEDNLYGGFQCNGPTSWPSNGNMGGVVFKLPSDGTLKGTYAGDGGSDGTFVYGTCVTGTNNHDENYATTYNYFPISPHSMYSSLSWTSLFGQENLTSHNTTISDQTGATTGGSTIE